MRIHRIQQSRSRNNGKREKKNGRLAASGAYVSGHSAKPARKRANRHDRHEVRKALRRPQDAA